MQRGNERADFTVTRLMVRQLEFVTAVEVQRHMRVRPFLRSVLSSCRAKTRSTKVFTQHRIVQASVLFHGQPRPGFKEGGGEQPDPLLAAPVAVFIIQAHAFHAAAWRFSTDDKTSKIANFRQKICRKVRHFLRNVFVRRMAKAHLRFAGGQNQTQRRARRRQADGHFRTDEA